MYTDYEEDWESLMLMAEDPDKKYDAHIEEELIRSYELSHEHNTNSNNQGKGLNPRKARGTKRTSISDDNKGLQGRPNGNVWE